MEINSLKYSLKTELDKLQEQVNKMQGEVLWEGAPNTGNIPIRGLGNLSYYDRIEIIWQRGTDASGYEVSFRQQFPVVIGKNIVLSSSYALKDSTKHNIILNYSSYTVNSSFLVKCNEMNVNIDGKTIASQDKSNIVAITKVIGYRK